MNHFYFGEIIFYYSPRPSSPSQRTLTHADILMRNVQNIALQFIRRHSNPNLFPDSSERLAVQDFEGFRRYNVFCVNIADFLNENLSINYEALQNYIRDVFAPLRELGFSHPFLRIYIPGHGNIGSDSVGYKFNDGIRDIYVSIPLLTFSQILGFILVGPNGIYRPASSRAYSSPLKCRIVLLNCYSSSGISQKDHSKEQYEAAAANSMAGKLLNFLKGYPISVSVIGQVGAIAIDLEGKRFQRMFVDKDLVKARGEANYKKIHHFDEKGSPVYVNTDYRIPVFTNLSFNKIYQALITLQTGLIDSSKPEYLYESIKIILRILDEIPMGQEENEHTCSEIRNRINTYIQDPRVAQIIDTHKSNGILKLLRSPTRTRTVFNKVLKILT